MSHLDEGVLQEWLDGELAGDALASAEAHVAGCPACHALLDEMRVTMQAADGLVARLEYEARPRAARPARRRIPSMRQMGIAAGLLVAVTAGLLLNSDRDRAAALGEGLATVPAAPPAASAERVDDDTFRLRAGSSTVSDQAAPEPAIAVSEQRQRRAAEAKTTAPREEQPAAPSAAVPPGVDAPAQRPARALELSVILRPRRIGALAPARLDTLPGTFRSTYVIGGTKVVLEESVRPLPEGRDEAESSSADANKAGHAAGLRAEAAVTEYAWEVRGVQLRLRGMLTRDSLEALSKLVR